MWLLISVDIFSNNDLDMTAAVNNLTVTASGSELLVSNNSQINISAGSTGTLLLTGNGAFLSLIANTAVNMQAGSNITIDQNLTLESNNGNPANWTLTAPTVQLNDGASLGTALIQNPLTIHTNNLNLGNSTNANPSNIYGNGVTIDDNGGAVFTTTGLTISIDGGSGRYIQSFGSPLAINATASSTSSLLITSTGGTLYLDGDNGSGAFGVALTANNQITIDQEIVQNQNSQGNWVLTAPTVTDYGTIETTNGTGPASLTIHTNNLNIGEFTSTLGFIFGKGITIDDNGGSVFSSTGLAIYATCFSEIGMGYAFIKSFGSPLVINATASSTSSLFLTGLSGSTLFLDGDNGSGTVGVQLAANNQIVVDQDIAVANNLSSGNWTVSAPAVFVNAGGAFAVGNGGSLAFTVSTTSGISQVYPSGLDLSATSPSLTAPSAGGVTVGSGASVSSNSTTVNSVSYGNSFGQGVYGVSPYLVTIATGNGPLPITPVTSITPAEWVAGY